MVLPFLSPRPGNGGGKGIGNTSVLGKASGRTRMLMLFEDLVGFENPRLFALEIPTARAGGRASANVDEAINCAAEERWFPIFGCDYSADGVQ